LLRNTPSSTPPAVTSRSEHLGAELLGLSPRSLGKIDA
jgi:hypothetical protein